MPQRFSVRFKSGTVSIQMEAKLPVNQWEAYKGRYCKALARGIKKMKFTGRD